MRMAYLLAAATALAALPARAEGDYVSFDAGLNLAAFIRDYPSGYDAPDQSVRIGGAFHIGYQMATMGNNATFLHFGYENKGAVWTDKNFSGQDVDVDIEFDYLQLGLQYRILFGPAGENRFYLAPGVGAALLINSEAAADGDSQNLDQVSSFDIELGGTLGVQFPVGRNAGFLEGGYGYGVFNTVDNSGSSDFSANNSVIKIRAGFLLGV